MPMYSFEAALVTITGTNTPAPQGATGVLRPLGGGNPVPLYDQNDSSIPHVLVGPDGVHQQFRAEASDGELDFGAAKLWKVSVEQHRAGLEAKTIATDAAASAQTALTLIGQLSPGESTGGSNVVYGTNVDATNLPDGTIVIELPEGTV